MVKFTAFFSRGDRSRTAAEEIPDSKRSVATTKVARIAKSTASRRAFLFPGNNLRSADSSLQWSFKRPLDATLSAFL